MSLSRRCSAQMGKRRDFFQRVLEEFSRGRESESVSFLAQHQLAGPAFPRSLEATDYKLTLLAASKAELRSSSLWAKEVKVHSKLAGERYMFCSRIWR